MICQMLKSKKSEFGPLTDLCRNKKTIDSIDSRASGPKLQISTQFGLRLKQTCYFGSESEESGHQIV